MKNQWPRLFLFALLAGGLIWWLSGNISPGNSGRVKSGFIEEIDRVLPEPIKEKVEQLEERVFKKSSQVVEESSIVQEIKSTVNQATEEIEGFPEKQKKEIKREVIRQVCDDLLKEFE